jgi:hypothetical protein
VRISNLFATAATILVAICVTGFTRDGYPNRYPQAEQRMLRYDLTTMVSLYREHGCFLQPQDSYAQYDADTCLRFAADKINILLAGDSTAVHLAAALRQYLDPNI